MLSRVCESVAYTHFDPFLENYFFDCFLNLEESQCSGLKSDFSCSPCNHTTSFSVRYKNLSFIELVLHVHSQSCFGQDHKHNMKESRFYNEPYNVMHEELFPVYGPFKCAWCPQGATSPHPN